MDMKSMADVIKSVADVIEALSKWAWPILAAYVAYKCLPTVIKVAKSRAFTIKVGDMEISVQEASEQIREHIKDLQDQVATLRLQIPQTPTLNTITEDTAHVVTESIPQRRIHLLWVAGMFEYHAYGLANLREYADVETATSTTEAIVKLKARASAFDAVISGMSRVEEGVRNPTAGITLTEEARALGYTGPIYIFCSPDNAKAHGAEVMRKGAQGATASTVQLFEWIKKTACYTNVTDGI